MLYNLSGGSAVEYDSLKRKDVFEFFHILLAHEKRIAKLKPKK